MNSDHSGDEQHGEDGWPQALSYWRRVASDAFGAAERVKIADCVRKLGATSPTWREAASGNVAAAIALVQGLGRPARIDFQVDLAMTLLLNVAFEDAEAALDLALAVHRMPLDRGVRITLSVSWQIRSVELDGDRTPGKR